MKNADFSRNHHHSHASRPSASGPAPSMFTALVRQVFVFLVTRAPRSRLAALGAATMALLFARRLMTRAATARQGNAAASGHSGRVIEGNFRRINDPS